MESTKVRGRAVQRPPLIRLPVAIDGDVLVRDSAGQLFPHSRQEGDCTQGRYLYRLTGHPPEHPSKAKSTRSFALSYAPRRLYNILTAELGIQNGSQRDEQDMDDAEEYWYFEFIGFVEAGVDDEDRKFGAIVDAYLVGEDAQSSVVPMVSEDDGFGESLASSASERHYPSSSSSSPDTDYSDSDADDAY